MMQRTRRTWKSYLTIILLAASLVGTASAQPTDSPAPAAVEAVKPEIAWRSNLTGAKAEAARRGLPVLIYFTAAWCGPCQAMKRDVFPDPKAVAAIGNTVAVMIDEAENRELLGQYKIDGFPTFVILDSLGNEVARASGGLTVDRLLEFVDYGRAVIKIKQSPDDADAIYRRGRWGVLFAPTLEQKREQVEAGLKAVGEADKEKRARLLIAKSMLVEPAEDGKAPEEAYKYLREAARLDPDNALAIREEADFFILALDASGLKDEALLQKAIAEYFGKYPPHTLRERAMALQLLEAQFKLQVKATDYEAAIKTLGITRTLVDDPKVQEYIDGLIGEVRKEMEKKSAGG